MKAINRTQLKALLKDIKEQLNSEVELQDIYAKGFYYCGDNIFTNDDIIFSGRITKKEMASNYEIDIDSLENYRILPTIQFTVYDGENGEEKEIVVTINIKTEHCYITYDGEYYIDILRLKY